MTDSNDDLWPDLTGEPEEKSPLVILREQAVILGMKTSNLVEAEVTATPSNHDEALDIQFTLKAPVNGYEYALLIIRQPIDLYPVPLSGGQKAKNEQEFKQYLKDLFKSERTVKIIRSFIAQSKQA